MQQQRSRFYLWLAIWFSILNGSSDGQARNELRSLESEVLLLRQQVEELRAMQPNTGVKPRQSA